MQIAYTSPSTGRFTPARLRYSAQASATMRGPKGNRSATQSSIIAASTASLIDGTKKCENSRATMAAISLRSLLRYSVRCPPEKVMGGCTSMMSSNRLAVIGGRLVEPTLTVEEGGGIAERPVGRFGRDVALDAVEDRLNRAGGGDRLGECLDRCAALDLVRPVLPERLEPGRVASRARRRAKRAFLLVVGCWLFAREGTIWFC